MKKIFFICLLAIIASMTFAFDIEFNAAAEKKFSGIDDTDKKAEKTGKNYKEKFSNFKKKLIKLEQSFPRVVKNDTGSRIRYHEKKSLKGVKRQFNREEYKNYAKQFLDSYFPDVLGTGEEIKVLDVMEDYGADQEKLDDGSISGEVSLKTYSFTVSMGRTFHGEPIFNSFAAVEIDAESLDVIDFTLTNWEPVQEGKETFSRVYPKDKVKNMIDNRLKTLGEKEKGLKKVKVEDILHGWVMDEEEGILTPAFLHYGTVEIEAEGVIETKQYSLLEEPSDSTTKGKDEETGEPSFNAVESTEEKPLPADDRIKEK